MRDGVEPVRARRGDAAGLCPAGRARPRSGGGRCRRCGCPGRCECPRIGHGPAPSRPMLPRSSSTLTISRIVSTPCSCWVKPRHQAMIGRPRLAVDLAPSRGSPPPSTPDWRSISRPRRRLDQRAVGLEPGGVAARGTRGRSPWGRSAGLEQVLGDAAQQRHVAGDPRLDVQRAGRVDWNVAIREDVVRHDRAAGGRLDQRVDVNDAARRGDRPRPARSASAGRSRRRSTPMTIRAVGLLPVDEVARALAGAERRGQRAAAGLVAHVRAVGQVVRARARAPRAGRGTSPRC